MLRIETILDNCIDALNNNGIILFPTDTIIGLGCDATNEESTIKLLKLKKRSSDKGFIILVPDIQSLRNYVDDIPNFVCELIDNTLKPLSIIYPKGINLSKNVLGKNGSIAIRVVKSGFAYALLKKYNKAIVATSVNVSDTETSYDSEDVPEEILSGLDYVVNLPSDAAITHKASTIIKLNSEGKIEIIRD